jgi:hypothetical protein
MNTPHDALDELLKNDAAASRDAYVDDAGFTAHVVGALPARHRLPRAVRIGVPVTFTVVATVVVMCFTAAGNLAIDAFMDLATETITANAVGMLLIIGVVIAVSFANLGAER